MSAQLPRPVADVQTAQILRAKAWQDRNPQPKVEANPQPQLDLYGAPK